MIDIFELAKKAGWGDERKKYMSEKDWRIWCERIERFAALYKQALIDSGELVEAEKIGSKVTDESTLQISIADILEMKEALAKLEEA